MIKVVFMNINWRKFFYNFYIIKFFCNNIEIAMETLWKMSGRRSVVTGKTYKSQIKMYTFLQISYKFTFYFTNISKSQGYKPTQLS